MRRSGRYPFIWHRLASVQLIVGSGTAGERILANAEIRIDEFPNDFAFAGHLEQPAALAFIDKGIAVGQAAGGADMGASKRPAGAAGIFASVLPDHLVLDGIDFQYPGAACSGNRRRRVSCQPLIVEYQQITGTGQTFRNDMGVMLGADLIHRPWHIARLRLFFAGGLIVRPQSPDYLAGLLVDDGDEVGVTGVEQQIVGIKAFVPGRKPVIGADHLEIVDMQVVGNLGIANQLKFLFAETEFVDMLGRDPFPDHLPGRVDFINHIIQHLRLLKAFYRMHKVSQHYGIAVRQARPVVVLLGGSAGRFFAERPNGFTVPIQFADCLGNLAD